MFRQMFKHGSLVNNSKQNSALFSEQWALSREYNSGDMKQGDSFTS